MDELLDLTLSSEDEEEKKCRESSDHFNQSFDRRKKKSETLPSKRELRRTKGALDSSCEEINSKNKKDSKKHMKISPPPDNQEVETGEGDQKHEKPRHFDTNLVLSQCEKEKIRRALKKGILQNLSSPKAKEGDQGDKSSDTAKPRSREMASKKDPDESDDFSGGTTPYRAVVYRNLEKMGKLRKLNKISNKNLKRKKTRSSEKPTNVSKCSSQVSGCDSDDLKSEILETGSGN